MIPYQVVDQINLGPWHIYTWGFFVGLAFLAGLFLLLVLAKKNNLDLVKIYNLAAFVFIGSLIGAKLGYLFQFPYDFFAQPREIFTDFSSGLTFYGGLIGALVASYIYIKKASLNFFRIADLAVLPLTLGIFIGRLGCFLTSQHQGAITALGWGILWPDGMIRHPVALYLSLNGLIMFLAFWSLKNRFKKPGHFFTVFLLWYGLVRFFLDFTRVSETPLADPQYFGLFISQWLSLGLIIFALNRLLKFKKNAIL